MGGPLRKEQSVRREEEGILTPIFLKLESHRASICCNMLLTSYAFLLTRSPTIYKLQIPIYHLIVDLLNRTFVGVRLPGPQYQEVSEKVILIKRKPGVDNIRWSAHSELLLNLCSLGELGGQTLLTMKPILRDVASKFPRLNLELKGFGGLPNLIQPRYMYVGIEGEDAHWLPSLAMQIDQATRPFTPLRDSKPFHAHVMLGRLKTENEQYRVALGRAIKLAEQPSMGPWQIDHLELLCSTASESGIGFTVVDTAPLG